MTGDASEFRPLVPLRLVPASPAVEMAGPGTRFRAGELVEESEALLVLTGGALLQLAVRRR